VDLQAALEWYAHLAKQAGWEEYVWRQVNDLAKRYPDTFGDLPKLLTAAMKEA
jgi:hypothetical protein